MAGDSLFAGLHYVSCSIPPFWSLEFRGGCHVSVQYVYPWGTRWCSWLRYCARSLKVAGSIPDGVIGIFHNSSGLHYDAAVDSASNRNEYQEYFRGVKAASV